MPEPAQPFNYDKAYFDRHYSSPAYRRFIMGRNRFIRDEVGRYVSGGRMIDLGFGDDNLVRFFRDRFEVYGTDIAEHALVLLPQDYDREHFKVANLDRQAIPFDVKFDAVCAVNTVEHLAEPEAVLRKVYNALNDNGVFALYLPTRGNWLSRVQYRFFYDVPEHIYRPSVPELEALLERTGFLRRARFAATFLPLRLGGRWFLESVNLYFGVWQKSAARPQIAR
jgi:SAM-dependent methyltransferase